MPFRHAPKMVSPAGLEPAWSLFRKQVPDPLGYGDMNFRLMRVFSGTAADLHRAEIGSEKTIRTFMTTFRESQPAG